MRLSQATNTTPADTVAPSAPADSGTVIPFNAPGASSFEQTLAQAQQSPSASNSQTAAQSQTQVAQPQTPQTQGTTTSIGETVPYTFPTQQMPVADPSAQGLVPFSDSAMPETNPTAAGLLPFTSSTPSATSSSYGLVPFSSTGSPTGSTDSGLVPFETQQPITTAQGLTPFSSSAAPQLSQLPITEPMAQGLVPFNSTPQQTPQASPTSGQVPFGSIGSTANGGYGYYPIVPQGMVAVPVGYMLVPVAMYPAYANYAGAALPYAQYAAPQSGSPAAVPNGVASTATGSTAASGTTDAAQATTPSGLYVPFNAPVDITQGFGPTSVTAEPSLNGYAHFHTGIDFALPSDTPIGAIGSGRIVAAGWDSTGYGNRVIIDHGNGLLTLYGHLDTVDVQVGQVVNSGQQIGLSGSTGNSTGPHLHFGVEANGTWVDPLPYLQQSSSNSTLAPGPTIATPSSTMGVGGASPQSIRTVSSFPLGNSTPSQQASMQLQPTPSATTATTGTTAATGTSGPPAATGMPVTTGTSATPGAPGAANTTVTAVAAAAARTDAVPTPVSGATGGNPPGDLRLYTASTLGGSQAASARSMAAYSQADQSAAWQQARRILAGGGLVRPPVANPLTGATNNALAGTQASGAVTGVTRARPGVTDSQSSSVAVAAAKAQPAFVVPTNAQTLSPVAAPPASQTGTMVATPGTASAGTGAVTTTPIWTTTAATTPAASTMVTTPAVNTTPAAVQSTAVGLSAMIQQAAAGAGISSSLLAAVVQAESSDNSNAVSPSGAKGLMQLMDGTAAQYGVKNPFDPQQNLAAGAQYLRDLLSQFHGNTSLAVAAYNAGPGAVTKYGGVPPYQETQAYVNRVLQLQQQYAAQGV